MKTVAEIVDKIFVGVVEANIDPYRLGRVKVRVQTMYDDIPLEHIPYATPFKSTDGKNFNIPAVGKVVSVVFDNGNIYMPVYHYSENYNINLQKKLDSLSDSEYQEFVAYAYDHKIQNYIDSKGYRLDFYYNQLHIDEESVSIRLKDNTSKLYLGSRDGNQKAVLGTNFFEWFNRLMDQLALPTAMIDSNGAPIQKPAIDFLIQEYKQIWGTFVSEHVRLPENNKIEKVKRDIQTVVKTNDVELLVNKQTPFELNTSNTVNSNILSEEVKQSIADKNSDEEKKLSAAQPSDILNTEEVDYHQDFTDPRTDIVLKKLDENGKEVSMSYEESLLESETLKDDAVDQPKVDNVNDTYGNEGDIISDDNYGNYAVDTQDKSSASRYGKTKVKIPPSVTKIDENGKSVTDTVPIYKNKKLVGNEAYVVVQGKKVVKTYYEPLKQMMDAADRDGCKLTLNEAYRHPDIQLSYRRKNELDDFTETELMENSSSNYNPITAKPGASIHSRGAAFDFSTGGGRNKAYKWLVQNAHKFGFIRTLPSETWHWEYQPWEYTGKSSQSPYAYVSKSNASWMGIAILT